MLTHIKMNTKNIYSIVLSNASDFVLIDGSQHTFQHSYIPVILQLQVILLLID
jgi:hypothetical protein